MSGANRLDEEELCFHLDNLIALTGKGRMEWKCTEYNTPIRISAAQDMAECMTQSVRISAIYNEKVFELDITETIAIETRKADMLVLFRLNDLVIAKDGYENESEQEIRTWDGMLTLCDMVCSRAFALASSWAELGLKMHREVMDLLRCEKGGRLRKTDRTT